MIGPERGLENGERARKQRLGLGVAVLIAIEKGEVDERLRDEGMIATERSLVNGERALEERLGVGMAALVAVELAEITHPSGNGELACA